MTETPDDPAPDDIDIVDTPDGNEQKNTDTDKAAGTPSAKSENSDHEQIYDLSAFKVLTVDDFSFITDLLASSLKELGVGKVIRADDGEKAKNLILQSNGIESGNSIDVLVLDWLMPGMSGKQLLEWIRNHEKESIKFLPVIVCSAYTSNDLVQKARDCGANEVMVKPVSADKLAKRIQHVVDNPRPYIRSPDFFGPNRRRKKEPFPGDEKRINKDEDIKQSYEKP